MKHWRGVLTCVVSLAMTIPAHAGDTAKVEGYAEYRKGEIIIVDGQRVRAASGFKFKGEGDARSFGAIPLGYEVKAEGRRMPDGSILAEKVEAKVNGSAMFESDVREATDEMEAAWLAEGSVFEQYENGHVEVVGKLHTSGPRVDRIRHIIGRLAPPYLKPSDFRVYVVDNKEWNAFACANGMIVVHSAMLDSMDDDEIAIVLGHEIAHATHEHSRRQFKKAMWIQLVAIGVAVGTEAATDSRKAKAIIGLASTFSLLAWHNGYGRENEDQADRVGLRYAHEAGYNVHKGPQLWRKFAQKYGNQNKLVSFFFSDHSQSLVRAGNLEREIAWNYAK